MASVHGSSSLSWALALWVCLVLVNPLDAAPQSPPSGSVTLAGVPASVAEVLAQAQAALQRGSYSQSVDLLEHLSDLGRVDANISFDRGLAYLKRGESTLARATDMAQAAAAFQEAVHLSPEDEEARRALNRLQEVLARRHTSRTADPVRARPRLLRAVVQLVGDNGWAYVGLFGALLLAVGIGCAAFARRGGSLRTVAPTLLLGGAGLACLGAGLAFAGQRLRAGYTPATVIVDGAQLLSESGRPRSGPRSRLPQGSVVYVAAHQGGLVDVEWGAQRAWLLASQIRQVATP